MSIEAYPPMADDEAVMVKVVAGSGGSRASGSHGPLDLDPAPCGGAKGGGKGKSWDMQDMQMALSASAAADDEEDTPKDVKNGCKKKRRPTEKGTQEAVRACYWELFRENLEFEKRFSCIDCRRWYTEMEAKAVQGMCQWCKAEGRPRKRDKWEDDNGKFCGSGSNHLPNIYNCDLCKESMPVASWVACIDPNSYEFIQRPDELFEQAVTGEFVRTFDAKTKFLEVCIFCKGFQDKIPYIKEKLHEKIASPQASSSRPMNGTSWHSPAKVGTATPAWNGS